MARPLATADSVPITDSQMYDVSPQEQQPVGKRFLDMVTDLLEKAHMMIGYGILNNL